MTAKIIPFIRDKKTKDSPKVLNFPRIINLETARKLIALEEQLESEILFEKDEGSQDRCGLYHSTTRGLRREIREGNPDSICCDCEGYDVNCPGYTSKKR